MIVVIPMAGRGSRFANVGESTPKPMIQVGGKPMVAWAMRSLAGLSISRIIFVTLAEFKDPFKTETLLPSLTEHPTEVLYVADVTEGQLCTVLVAKDFINSQEDLLIAASDTLVESSLAVDIAKKQPNCRGMISVADMPGESWSFARTDESGNVVEVAEKRRISNHASTGLYYFTHGSDFVSFGEQIVANNERTRGEFYVIPVYQKFIEKGWPVHLSIAERMWDMGTPAAKTNFEANYLAKQSSSLK